MTPLPSDLLDDSSIHASGRRAVTTETSRTRAGLTGRQGHLGVGVGKAGSNANTALVKSVRLPDA